MDMLSMLKSANNPQAFLVNMIQQKYGGNPIMQNVIRMINSNDARGIETIARNMCQERGINADNMLNSIIQRTRM